MPPFPLLTWRSKQFLSSSNRSPLFANQALCHASLFVALLLRCFASQLRHLSLHSQSNPPLVRSLPHSSMCCRAVSSPLRSTPRLYPTSSNLCFPFPGHFKSTPMQICHALLIFRMHAILCRSLSIQLRSISAMCGSTANMAKAIPQRVYSSPKRITSNPRRCALYPCPHQSIQWIAVSVRAFSTSSPLCPKASPIHA